MKECEKIINSALEVGRTSLLLHEAMEICKLHGIPMPDFCAVFSKDEAIERAGKLGYPVALKIISSEILHKSESDAIVLNIEDEGELRKEYEDLVNRVGKDKIEGILVEEMVSPSTEVIIGGVRDKQFGPSVMFGMGGIFTEVYDDVAFRVAPIDKRIALNLIREPKGSKILKGVRGNPPKDLDSIADVLVRVSDLMIEHEVVGELDLNPVIAYPDGVSVVDARIILEKEEE